MSGLSRLDKRREELLSGFASKAEQSERFGNVWFSKKEASGYGLRREKKYIEEFANRDRLRNAPIYRMRQILNEK